MRLNQISMADFIELACGNYSVVPECDGKEASRLILEYRNIVSPSGMQSMLIEKEDEVKLTSKIMLLKICITLYMLGYEESTLQIMREWISGYSKEGEDMLRDIKNKLREAEFVEKRHRETKVDEKPPTEDEIRSSFDAEIAFLITYFKMPLDIEKTNAAVYANIVHRAQEEIKVQMRKRG